MSPPKATPAAPGRRRFHILRQVLQNALAWSGRCCSTTSCPVANDDHPVWRWAVFIVGLGVLIFLIVRQLRKQLAAGSDPGVRVHTLITLLYPVVVLFALTYYVIQTHRPDPVHRPGDPHRLAVLHGDHPRHRRLRRRARRRATRPGGQHDPGRVRPGRHRRADRRRHLPLPGRAAPRPRRQRQTQFHLRSTTMAGRTVRR